MNLDSARCIVERTEALWSNASLKGDIDGIVALYTEDAVFFGSLPRLFVGRQGIREYFNSVPLSAARAITFFEREVRILTNDTIATAAYVHFDLELASGLTRWRFGISWTLASDDGNWRIVSHHASPREIATREITTRENCTREVAAR